MSTRGPLAKYRALLTDGALKKDSEQARVAGALQSLHDALRSYRPPTQAGFLARLFRARVETPRGLYIHGGVGRGKSLLMDMFFDSVETDAKRRVHFNPFMSEVHQRIHEWRNLSPAERAGRPEYLRDAGEAPIAPVAKRIAMEAWVLCLDEFQVIDVADAMILGRLFEKLLSLGVVIVLTSNVEPDHLYEGGLNRQLFLPFIAALKARMTILELDGGKDYRQQSLAGVSLYNMPLGPDADAAMDSAWDRLTGSARPQPHSLDVFGRKFEIPRAAAGVARFSFDELCGKPLGASDYVALAAHFHTLLLDKIPKLSKEQTNEARRLGLLIDTLYDEKTKFICSADAAPDALFDMRGKTSWFERTASRLIEMQSEDYLALPERAS